MKRFYFLFLLTLLPLLASADDKVEIDGICYNLIPKGNAAEVTANFYSGDVIIPEQFIYNDINYTVISIGGHAFENCNSLTSITIPNSIKSISEYAFYKCAKLSAVKVYDLTAWCNIDFKGFAASPLQYAHHLYVNDEEIVDLIIPSKVTTINKDAFKGCTSITSVTIPNSVTNIGYESFYGCTSLTSVAIGDNKNDVASTIIGFRAFSTCSELGSVTIGNNVKQIENNAFEYCASLASITIPNSVESIGRHVFMSCTNLSSVQLPENISSIEWATFSGCTSLESITIPNTVETIGEGAFSHCINLTSIILPNNLSSIGPIAFESCYGLTSITIPDKVTTIEQGAFYDCKNLTDITLGRGIKTLRCGSFTKCPQLSNVYCYAEDVPICNTEYFSYYGKAIGVFEDSFIEYATLHVPTQSLDAYKAAEPWKNFKEITNIPMPTYTLTYILDGEVYKTSQVTEGAAITPEPAPTKEGYEFSGWSTIPATMPAEDVTITGTFSLLTDEDVILITSAGQSTWCSKYDLDFTGVEGLKAYTATGYDRISGTIWLTRVYQVPANEGIFLMGNADEYHVPHKSTGTYYANLMVGTLQPITIYETDGEYTNYYLSNGDSGVGFYKVNGSVDLKANRAYLPLLKGSVQAGTRFIGIEFEDDGTTNIKDLTPVLSEGEGEWYTLQGQRVAKPGKGLYIHNGHKVVIK
jgi:hypothetical protein